MNALRAGMLGLGVLIFSGLGAAQFAPQFAPPGTVPLKDEDRQAIEGRVRTLSDQVAILKRQGVRDPGLADLEIFPRAVKMVLAHEEFYDKNYAAWINEVLDRGFLRVKQAARGDTPWYNQPGQATVRAYRSRVDDSVQPYAVTLPHDYLKAPGKAWRLDVVLHGRNGKLTEVSFLKQFDGSKQASKDQKYVQLDIFGRGNNAYRWAGETDVFEALENFLATEAGAGRAGLIDMNKIVMRGFSMGGAGAWHLGLHHPDRWCVVGPGAGFATTHGYIKDLPKQLPDYLEMPLRIYDAVDYAENAFNVPVVAYAGTEDAQKAAGEMIQARLKEANIPMQMILAPGVAHAVPAEWAKKLEAEYAKAAETGRPGYPKKVRFVTWTTKYDGCDWVQIFGLEQHYKKALVEAESTEKGFKVKTENVRVMSLRLPPGTARGDIELDIDGKQSTITPSVISGSAIGDLAVYLEKREGRWVSVLPEYLIVDQVRRPQKSRGLCGPIDDAFTESFLCVRGTGTPWHEGTRQYAEADLKRFAREWAKYLRGNLPIKDDVDVTPEDLASKNLILFGDPGSNRLIAQALPGLPLGWTKETIRLGKDEFAAGEHVPVLIYPSPLARRRYVVLNSGHTFHEADFKGTNALLYPRLGDYAVLKRTPTKEDELAVQVSKAGLFDEFWHLR